MPTNIGQNGVDPLDRSPELSGSRDGHQRAPGTMNVVVEYRVPAEGFVIGRALVGGSVATIERLCGENETTVQYVWIEGGSRLSFERSARGTTGIDGVRLLDRAGGRWLYRVECDPTRDALVGALSHHDVDVLFGGGDDGEWRFRLSFPDRTTISEFQTACVDDGTGVKLDSVYYPVEVQTPLQAELTDPQRETLARAYDEGYFEVPRRTTLVELAEMLDISDQSVSERLRRGEAKLVRAHLQDDL